MKNFLLFVFSIACLSMSALLIFGTYAFNASGPLTSEKIVLLPKGSGVLGMAKILERQYVIRDEYVFAAFARATGTYKSLKAGEYQFAPQLKMRDVLAKIAAGDIYKRNVTIPEGKTSYEIVEILKSVPSLAGDIGEVPAEGSLLPETYAYQSGDARADKIRIIQANMAKALEKEWGTRDADLPLKTPQEAVTLASIVEKETGVAAERPRIAGAFINRLKIGMPLQSDPTVIYAITRGENKNDGQGPLGRRLLLGDLQTPSPYNTYLNAGLPPGPIANPGLASIHAVLHPEKNDFLFFVADGSGGHVFAATLQEHNRNVARWHEMRKEKSQ